MNSAFSDLRVLSCYHFSRRPRSVEVDIYIKKKEEDVIYINLYTTQVFYCAVYECHCSVFPGLCLHFSTVTGNGRIIRGRKVAFFCRVQLMEKKEPQKEPERNLMLSQLKSSQHFERPSSSHCKLNELLALENSILFPSLLCM